MSRSNELGAWSQQCSVFQINQPDLHFSLYNMPRNRLSQANVDIRQAKTMKYYKSMTISTRDSPKTRPDPKIQKLQPPKQQTLTAA